MKNKGPKRNVTNTIIAFAVAITALLMCSCVSNKRHESIVGSWLWVASKEGWTDTMEGTFSTGDTRRVIFEANGKVTFYKNGEVTLSTTYSLREDSTIEKELFPVVYVGDRHKYVYSFLDENWLELREDANDGSTHWYEREYMKREGEKVAGK